MRDATTITAGAMPDPETRRDPAGDRRFALGWGALALTLVAAAPFGATLARFVPACPLKTLTGIPCPGCGTTRAALALTSEPLHALAHYPVPALAWALLILGGLVAGALALAGRPPRRPRTLPPWVWRGAAVVFLANWIWNLATGV